jgi:predicted HTH domain antitoxin
LGKVAELAGYSRIAFIEELARRGEPIFDFTAEEVNELIAQADVVEKLLESRTQ